MAEPDFRVFISWSGQLARQVATKLYEWLPHMFDNIDPFMSSESIESGQRGLRVIEDQLTGTQFGIVVTTQQNQHASWLNFEAGAISKVVEDSIEQRVVPYLIDFSSTADVTGPLSQFQMRLANREQTLQLMQDMGAVMGRRAEAVTARFDAFWPQLEESISEARTKHQQAPTTKTTREVPDMVAEVLELVRGLRNEAADSSNWSRLNRHQLTRPIGTGVVTFGDLATAGKQLTSSQYVKLKKDIAQHIQMMGLTVPDDIVFTADIGGTINVNVIYERPLPFGQSQDILAVLGGVIRSDRYRDYSLKVYVEQRTESFDVDDWDGNEEPVRD